MSGSKKMVFDSKLLPDGHLFCPKELANQKNLHFRVIVTDEVETDQEVSGQEIEYANTTDVSTDFLSEEELHYYLNQESPHIVFENGKSDGEDTYQAILKGDQVKWIQGQPNTIAQEREVKVLIKLIKEMNPPSKEEGQNGERMAQCLEKIAQTGGVIGISDPAEWQREIRNERNIYPGF